MEADFSKIDYGESDGGAKLVDERELICGREDDVEGWGGSKKLAHKCKEVLLRNSVCVERGVLIVAAEVKAENTALGEELVR